MHMDHIARTEGTLYQILRGEMRMSSSLVGRLKFQSALLVNGTPQRTNYPVHPGDLVSVLLQENDSQTWKNPSSPAVRTTAIILVAFMILCLPALPHLA